jgi:hypothetical protein
VPLLDRTPAAFLHNQTHRVFLNSLVSLYLATVAHLRLLLLLRLLLTPVWVPRLVSARPLSQVRYF